MPKYSTHYNAIYIQELKIANIHKYAFRNMCKYAKDMHKNAITIGKYAGMKKYAKACGTHKKF